MFTKLSIQFSIIWRTLNTTAQEQADKPSISNFFFDLCSHKPAEPVLFVSCESLRNQFPCSLVITFSKLE
jgi:hypothetical protein